MASRTKAVPKRKQQQAKHAAAKPPTRKSGAKAKPSGAKAKPVGAKAKPSGTKARPASAKAKAAAKAKPVGAKRKPTGATRKQTQAGAPRARAATSPSDGSEQLGAITAPSGTLAVFDVGLMSYLPRPALEPAIVKASVPSGRELQVIGRRVGKGRFADCWDHVVVKIGDGEVTHSKKLGEAGVDFARLVCIDHGALDHWQHEDSLDGLADFVFWGRDAEALAKVMRAPTTREGHGWTDLPIEQAEQRALEADRLKAENRWLLAADFRPHTHHYYALAEARKSKQGAGTIEVGGARACLFFTSWGDGVFPIYLDLDHGEEPVQLRVQLNTVDSLASMHAVNR